MAYFESGEKFHLDLSDLILITPRGFVETPNDYDSEDDWTSDWVTSEVDTGWRRVRVIQRHVPTPPRGRKRKKAREAMEAENDDGRVRPSQVVYSVKPAANLAGAAPPVPAGSPAATAPLRAVDFFAGLDKDDAAAERSRIFAPSGAPGDNYGSLGAGLADVSGSATGADFYYQSYTKLLNVWAAASGAVCSAFVLAYIGLLAMRHDRLSSGVLLAAILGLALAPVVLATAIAHIFPKYAPQFMLLKLGRHIMLYIMAVSLAVVPYSQHERILAALFFAHIVPAALFYIARARCEMTPKKILVESARYVEYL